MDLAKHVTGAPLTDAEHEQRVAAARARWAGLAAASGAVAGGTLGAFLANRRDFKKQVATLQAHHAGVMVAEAKRTAMVERVLATRGALADKAIRKWPVPLYQAVRQHDVHTVTRGIARLPAEEIWHGDGEIEHIPIDQDRLHALLGARDDAQRALGAIPPDARPPVRGTRKATFALPPKRHTRKVKQVLAPAPDAAPATRSSAPAFSEDELRDEATHLHGLQDEGDIHEYVRGRQAEIARGAARDERRAKRMRSVTREIDVGTREAGDEGVVRRFRRGGRPRQAGVPGDKALAGMRTELRQRVTGLLREARYREWDRSAANRKAAIAGGRAGAAAIRTAAEAVRANPWRIFRSVGAAKLGIGGALLGAAALGAGAFGLAHMGGKRRRVEKLAKQAPPDDARMPTVSDDLMDYGLSAESQMANRLARVFRAWKDEAVPSLLDNPGGKSLLDHITAGFSRATEPLATAARGGADTPIPALIATDGRAPQTVAFSMGARNPLLEAFVDRYRQDKIKALTDDQMAAVQGVLVEAARTGASPQTMARQIRETIGLTAQQSAAVLAYRRELETLHPGSLGRALRDKRYDSPITRAIEQGEPLPADQVDRAVDAYHRRYLAYRAMTIARTEGVGAANNGHMAAVQDALDAHPGFEVQKTWVATLDDRTRPDHVGLHGQTVFGMEAPFTAPSGDKLRWPHDPNGSARNVINCRCTINTRLVKVGTRFVADAPQREDA